MHNLDTKKIAILATNGFEQSELMVPLEKLKAAGAQIDIVSPENGEIRSWDKSDWGQNIPVDRKLDSVKADEYDALVLPGGQINPDLLRVNDGAITLIKDFWNQKKVIAAICHAPWLLIEAGIIEGKNVTSYKSVKTDIINAGGKWRDEKVVTDKGLITSRNPGDLDAFCEKISEEINEGLHERRAA